MHEMSLCENILEIIEEQAQQQNYQKVKTIYLEIGTLSSVEPDAMQFCFDAVMQSPLVLGAKLEITIIQGKAWCTDCAKNVEIDQRYDACPSCGGLQLQINAGETMRIKELEVE